MGMGEGGRGEGGEGQDRFPYVCSPRDRCRSLGNGRVQ